MDRPDFFHGHRQAAGDHGVEDGEESISFCRLSPSANSRIAEIADLGACRFSGSKLNPGQELLEATENRSVHPFFGGGAA